MATMKTPYSLAIESAVANLKFASETKPSNERWICVEGAVGCLLEAVKELELRLKTAEQNMVLFVDRTVDTARIAGEGINLEPK